VSGPSTTGCEFEIQIAVSLGSRLLVFSRHPATCLGDLEGPGSQRSGRKAGFASPRALQSGFAPGRLLCRDGEEMTGNGHNNREGNSGDAGEPEPGPYWKRMHRDWRFG
jgi:hypothetical protein